MSVSAESARAVLHAEEVGSDYPVLLLHPALGSFELFVDERHGGVASWIAARGCRVIGPDLPGHGKSAPIERFLPGYIEQCAKSVLGVMDSKKVTRAALAGVGFGGLVALKMAILAPRRISCIIGDSVPGSSTLVGLEPWPGLAPVGSQGERMLLNWRNFTPFGHWNETFLELILRVKAPSLIITCGDGHPAELAELYALAKDRPQLQMATVPGDSPPACLRAPSFFLRELEHFLAAYAS